MNPPAWSDARGRGLAHWCAVAWLVALGVAAALADVLPLADPADTTAGPMSTGPTASNWLGTDQLGRDLLARTVFGARVSIVVGIAAVVASGVVGGTLGVLAGYFRRRTEAALMFAADVLLAFPAFLLAIGVVSFTTSRGIGTVTAAIALIYLGPTMRLVRSVAMVASQREYVVAARSIGATHVRIIMREIMPDVLPRLLAIGLVAVAGAMVAEGGLAYLNLSVAQPTPTWGAMISSGVTVMRDTLYPSLVPAGAMFLTILSLTVVGDRVQATRSRATLL